VTRCCTNLITLLAVLALPAAGAAERFSHSAAMHRVESGNYYVHGSFGAGVETDLLVDTGSGYVALTRDTFERIKALSEVTYLRDISGSMANGKRMNVSVYRVASLRIGESCVLTDVEVAVMPGGTRDILGLSALRKVEPFAMQLDPPVLYLSACVVDGLT
jgi:clan AA aspartic protease (TIGR02281 family)